MVVTGNESKDDEETVERKQRLTEMLKGDWRRQT